MKRILILALSVLMIGASAQRGILPNSQFEFINCDVQGSVMNLASVDGRGLSLHWLGIPENPPELFGMQVSTPVAPDTSTLRIRVAANNLFAEPIDQLIQVYDFAARDWMDVSVDRISGAGPLSKVVEVVLTSPVALFPPAFVDPESGRVVVRVLWRGNQTSGVLLDYLDIRPFR